MKTISMIGLINNIYNEFNIPEKIKINYGYYEETFEWDKNEKWFVTLDDSTLLRIDQNKLNMEVEIIEEGNKIKKLEGSTDKSTSLICRLNNIEVKINEIIDKLNERDEDV